MVEIIENEMKRIKTDPELQHLIPKNKVKIPGDQDKN